MKKSYYVVKDIAGCFGCLGRSERLPERFTNKKDAEKFKREQPKDKRVLYFVDFDWEA